MVTVLFSCEIQAFGLFEDAENRKKHIRVNKIRYRVASDFLVKNKTCISGLPFLNDKGADEDQMACSVGYKKTKRRTQDENRSSKLDYIVLKGVQWSAHNICFTIAKINELFEVCASLKMEIVKE